MHRCVRTGGKYGRMRRMPSDIIGNCGLVPLDRNGKTSCLDSSSGKKGNAGQQSHSSTNPMNDLHIVSFLPAATEMAYALGLGGQLAGVSHECDFPAEAQSKPVVVRPALALEKMSLREIDTVVSARLRHSQSLYEVYEHLLRRLQPNLILTQDLCQVCAPSGNELAVALRLLQPKPEVVWMSPHSLEEINQNLRALGQATGRAGEAEALIAATGARLEKIA